MIDLLLDISITSWVVVIITCFILLFSDDGEDD